MCNRRMGLSIITKQICIAGSSVISMMVVSNLEALHATQGYPFIVPQGIPMNNTCGSNRKSTDTTSLHVSSARISVYFTLLFLQPVSRWKQTPQATVHT